MDDWRGQHDQDYCLIGPRDPWTQEIGHLSHGPDWIDWSVAAEKFLGSVQSYKLF